jgi:hypothetical protein
MSTDRDVTRDLRSWLHEDAHEDADRVLGLVLDRIDTTPQRRSSWLARRSPIMSNNTVRFGIAAAAVVLVALLGIRFLPGLNVGSQRQTDLPSPIVSNGWIAYSTDGQLPGSTDSTTGSDIYLVRAGVEPRLIAGREGGTTRNVCPAFSPDGLRLAFGVASNQGRAVVVLGVDANGVISDTVRIMVPGSGSGVCVRWSSDSTRIAYLDGGIVVVRGLDGSTPTSVAGDPRREDFEPGRQYTDPLPSPSGDRMARLSGSDCQIVVARPDGTAPHVIPPGFCPYAIPAWSPDGRQILLMQDVSGHDFTMHAISVDSPFDMVTIVSTVHTNGARSWPGWGDVSWQPVHQ